MNNNILFSLVSFYRAFEQNSWREEEGPAKAPSFPFLYVLWRCVEFHWHHSGVSERNELLKTISQRRFLLSFSLQEQATGTLLTVCEVVVSSAFTNCSCKVTLRKEVLSVVHTRWRCILWLWIAFNIRVQFFLGHWYSRSAEEWPRRPSSGECFLQPPPKPKAECQRNTRRASTRG